MERIDLSKGFWLLDGAMGTMIQKENLPPAPMPELYSLTHPEVIQRIHEAYIDAGSQILYANTFGASPIKFQGRPERFEEVIQASISIAKKAAQKTGAFVALDLGPLGKMMEPMGDMSFEQAYEAFSAMVKCGAKAGADLIVVETMTDLHEAKAAVLAAKEHSDLPVMVTMTFEENGRTFMGCSLEAAVMTLEGLQADAIGLNCSLGPEQLVPLLKKICQMTALPVISKANAGLPDPITGKHSCSDEDFVSAMKEAIDAGVTILGGCCGTTPSTIAALKQALSDRLPATRKGKRLDGICSSMKRANPQDILIVGERINPTGKKRLAQALLENDLNYVARMALDQMEEGANVLDINVGYPGVDEVTMLPAVVKKVQSVCDLPLLLDSSNSKALEEAMRVVNGKAAINSVNGKEESLQSILPLAKKYGSPVVALCLDEQGIGQTVQERFLVAQNIALRAQKLGLSYSDLWFDALTLTVSAQQDQGMVTLQTLELITRYLNCPTILGVSNISFGLPQRRIMTRTFLNAALAKGLKMAIINPAIAEYRETISAWRVLTGQDEQCKAYIEAFAQTDGTQKSGSDQGNKDSMSLKEAVEKGLEQEAVAAAEKLLNEVDEMTLVEEHLIPALDCAGEAYEKGIFYLPQLLASANAAQAVFEVLRTSMASKGRQNQKKGKIVLATVQGDIHDIGKNIVKTLLENYSFEVVDLGKDVAPEKVVQAVLEEGVQLVGLSALMTTTLPAMEKTIDLLRQLERPVRIMVGGAVLTEEAAMEMGADFYAKDARESVAFARKVFQQ